MICVPPPGQPQPAAAERLAVQLSRRWHDRTVLRVCFLEGDPALRQYVAGEVCGLRSWNACSALQFVFGDEEEAEVRIAFQPGGSWSYLGTDCLWYPPEQATMNLAILLEDAGPHIDRVINHEFGHACGYPHGQLVPGVGELNLEAVYEFYRLRMGWSRQMTDAQVVNRLDANDVEGVALRGRSVMNYDMPGELWQDGQPLETAAYPTYWDAYGAELFYGPPPYPHVSVMLPIAGRA